ncbi:MAG TPA: aminotransferase class V-fold PLP-dependent enzyme, partial [Gemmatimonadaceae bacterium]|nr:aminotransferase class V-fold PLP-dependent enzyme [Gemmatimonadaceae bacterium]
NKMTTRSLLSDAAERAATYLESLPDRSVAPTAEAVAALSQFEQPLPEHPQNPSEVLATLDELGSPGTGASAGGRYFGFVIGATLPAALAANMLATAWDQNCALVVISPTTAKLESIALRWLLDVLHLPPTSAAGFVTGATMANFTCLAAARHALLQRAGWDAESQGLFGAPPLDVIVGDEVHVTALKALAMLGLGRARVTRVPVDSQGRMRADSLPALTDRTILCLQAGNVNTGAIDPLAEIIPRARAAGAWVHIDGAFGLWAAAAPARAALVAGIENADSWAVDAHKWLNVPYDSGVAIVRDKDALRGATAVSAAYLVQGAERDPSEYTPELSRRARGVDVWAAMSALGRSGIAEMIERNCRQAARFATGLRDAGYEILADVVLNQVLVSFGDDETTRRVIAGIQTDGTCWCGGTVWQGRTAMRISVSSWATTDEDVELSLAAMLRVASEVHALR